jgi:hypothetical protein
MKSIRFILVLLIATSSFIILAQDDMMTPSVTVSDQVSLNGHVVIDEVMSEGVGFIVIHADNDGAPGAVIGFRSINDGMSANVSVPIDATQATTTLYAMLHTDTGVVGEYEFGAVEGADGPVAVDGAVVTPAFNVEVVRAYDQMTMGNSINIASVVTAQNGFVVVHADNNGAPGPVLGVAPVTAGMNSDVAVELDGDITTVVFPMLHVDTGVEGEYEFGTVEGADGPVIVNGVVATFPITIGEPSMRVADQIVTNQVVAETVVSEGLGWLVIHADNDGAPGPVLGVAQVEAGTNWNVVVELEGDATSVLFPMLHVDTGVEGEYEFGTVDGADGPVMVEMGVLTFPINAASSITYEGSMDGTTLTVDSALIDVQGWLVIHDDNDGAPGPVLGQTPLVAGLNSNIVVELSGDMMSDTVFPMLHVDTGEAGVYEFGAVEGADGPVQTDGAVVTGPLTPSMME